MFGINTMLKGIFTTRNEKNDTITKNTTIQITNATSQSLALWNGSNYKIESNPVIREIINQYLGIVYNSTIIAKSPLRSILNKPNTLDSKYSLYDKILTNLLLYGNAYIQYTKTNNKVSSLNVLHTPSVILTFTKNKNGKVVNTYVKVNEVKINYNNIIHLKRNISFANYGTQGGDSYTYLSGLINNLETAEASLKKLLELNVSLRGIITTSIGSGYTAEKGTKDLAVAKTNEALQRGTKSVITLPEGMTWENLSNGEMSKSLKYYTDIIDSIKNKIYNFFGLDISMLSKTLEGENYNVFVSTKVLPILKQIGNSFKVLDSSFRFIPYNFISELDFNKKLINNVKGGLYTINEARRKLGLPKVEGGDKIRVSLNEVSIDIVDDYQTNMSGSKKKEE